LNSVDVNSFLYKYEKTFRFLKKFFGGTLNIDNTVHTCEEWDAKADFRKDKINELCWNEVSNMYFDYDFVKAISI
jgi:alpha,alpha-trehalase